MAFKGNTRSRWRTPPPPWTVNGCVHFRVAALDPKLRSLESYVASSNSRASIKRDWYRKWVSAEGCGRDPS